MNFLQASEQYLTSCQFLAHDLRHVISRPHTWQGLLGKFCLLPLNEDFVVINEQVSVCKQRHSSWVLVFRSIHCLYVFRHPITLDDFWPTHFFPIPYLATPTNTISIDDASSCSTASWVFTHGYSFTQQDNVWGMAQYTLPSFYLTGIYQWSGFSTLFNQLRWHLRLSLPQLSWRPLSQWPLLQRWQLLP